MCIVCMYVCVVWYCDGFHSNFRDQNGIRIKEGYEMGSLLATQPRVLEATPLVRAGQLSVVSCLCSFIEYCRVSAKEKLQ